MKAKTILLTCLLIAVMCFLTGTALADDDRFSYSTAVDVYGVELQNAEIVTTIINPESVIAAFNKNYSCDDQYEFNIVSRPVISDVLNRDQGKDYFVHLSNGQTLQLNPVYDAANTNDSGTLFQIRIKFRNLTFKSMPGLLKSSFTLSGYVRNRRISYHPILIQHYDWREGSWASERSWNIESPSNKIEPLRELDLLVIFQVHPFLYNWELTVEPQPTQPYIDPESYQFDQYTGVSNWATGRSRDVSDAGGIIVSYPQVEPHSCRIVFRLTEVQNTNTGVVMRTIQDP